MTVSQVLVASFGGLLVVICLAGVVSPALLLRAADRAHGHRMGLPAAVGVRVVLGVALLLAASGSRWPVLFQVLGWLSLAAAVGILLLGRARMSSVVDWIRGFHPVLVRLWLVAGVLFGAVLLYGALG